MGNADGVGDGLADEEVPGPLMVVGGGGGGSADKLLLRVYQEIMSVSQEHLRGAAKQLADNRP